MTSLPDGFSIREISRDEQAGTVQYEIYLGSDYSHLVSTSEKLKALAHIFRDDVGDE